MDAHFATKTDLKESELNIKKDFLEIRKELADVRKDIVEFKNEFNSYKSETKYNFKSLESNLVLKLGALQVASIAFIASLILIMK